MNRQSINKQRFSFSQSNLVKSHYQLKTNKQRGFTLIEVMVALAILAVVAVAASQASMGYLKTVEGMKSRTYAQFVAQNAAAQLRMNQEWLKSNRSEQITQQGYVWQIQYQIITNLPNLPKNIQVVDIIVRPANSTDINQTNIKQSNNDARIASAGSQMRLVLSKPD